MTRSLSPAAGALFVLLALLATAAPVRAGESVPLAQWRAPVSGMRFVRLPAGAFTMGSPASEAQREAQESEHRVTLTRDFWLGRFEVTQEEWRQVVGGSPSQFSDCGPDCPVENVSGLEVQRFLERMSEIEGLAFRLPTEAEWECACRAGGTTPFSTGATITTGQANFDGRYPYPGSPPGTYRRSTTPVGSFPPNAWGLHDLHGNVWEWTADRHCPYPSGAATDPGGACDSSLLVIRGGSWIFGADSTRCALRYTHHPQDRGPSLGFRVARDLLPDER